jgi:hypothetical protein
MFVRGLICRDEFAHRVNSNNTVDSICLHCFATVASLQIESSLRVKEAVHRCWQRDEYMIETEAKPTGGCLVSLPALNFPGA